MKYGYTTIDTVFAKVERDLTSEFSERDIIEWTGEALGFMKTKKMLEEAVAFIEVKNHQCYLPKGLQGIIQIARDNEWTPEVQSDLCPQLIEKEVCVDNPYRYALSDNCGNTYPTDKDGNPVPDYLLLDHNGQPIADYEVAYYRPYFDLVGEYNLWSNSPRYRSRYTPVRVNHHSFALVGDLICTETDQSIYRGCTDTYKIIKPNMVRFSFKEGSIAIAYLRTLVDKETGFPLIPDSESHLTAIVKYITLMMYNKLCYAGREGACGKADRADRDWQWYCKQSGNFDKMPDGIDGHQDLLDQRTYLMPQMKRYFGFFGNLNSPEVRTWNR
jgi:hypothetical protein